ncbi:MAG: YncE family protein [Saprospiraceae bacterium]|nr:YncE family protein [Saprospiraceae bacterium]
MKIHFKVLFVVSIISLTYACMSPEKKEEPTKTATPESTVLETENAKGKAIKVGKGPDAMFLTPDKQKIYIANVEDTTISVINTQTDQVDKTISGVRYPWGFSRLGNTNEVAVSAYEKQMVVIDFTTDKIVRQRDFNSPLGGVVASKDGKFIFVIAIEVKKVFKLNAQTLEDIDSYNTGNAPDGIGLSANENNIYVTNTEDGTISIIDSKTKKSKIRNLGGKPELIHANHDRTLLYISNFKNNTMYVVDSDKEEITHTISGLDGPEEAVPNENEDKLYIINFNSSKIDVYKTDGYVKLDETYTTGNQPIGIVPLANKIYVTNYGDNSVSVIKINH